MASQNLTPQTFAVAVLHGLGIQPTAQNVRALVGWQAAEGGNWHNDARYNPLNTTQNAPGAGNTGSQGNIKQYTSWDQGVQATVQTLKNGSYGGILSALRAGDPGRVAQAIGASRWGTSAQLVSKTIGGTPAGSVPKYAGGGAPSTPAAPTAPRTTTTTTTPGVDNSAARASAIQQFLGTKGADPLDFAMQIRSLQDVAGRTTSSSSGGGSIRSSGSAGAGGKDYLGRAEQIDKARLPYVWGGGHGGKVNLAKGAVPADCSGVVSEVLGINPRVASQFKAFGQPGEGGAVTIYAKDTHVLMKIRGRDGQWHFFGTSRTNPGGGGGWIPASAIDPSYLKGFTARHI